MIEVILKAAISSFLATLGFGVLFNIKRDKLIYAGITGAIGGILYKVMVFYGYGEYLSNFIASIGLSICAEILARKCKTPVTTYVICALIPLVPGGYLFRMMSLAMQGLTLRALTCGFTMFGIAIALALGIIVVSTVFRGYSLYKRIKTSNLV